MGVIMLSIEEYQEIGRQNREQRKKEQEHIAEVRRQELMKMGVNPNIQNTSKPKYDHPCMPNDGFITMLYIIGMAGSLIFNQWYIAWFGLTVAYFKFITRHDND